MTAPVVTHFLRNPTAERTACGRYLLNVYRRTTDASKVNCRACLKDMTAFKPAVITNTEGSTNA